MDAPPPATARLERFGYPLGLVVAATFGHAPALRNGFVLDDDVLLATNPHVQSLAGLRELVSHELFMATAEPRFVPYYRPLSGLLNWLSYQLVGASAPLQHLLNLLLHAGVTLLLFRVVGAFGVRAAVAFGAALLFAVHPATADAVAYIGGRQDMLGWLVGLYGFVLVRRFNGLPALAGLAFGATVGASLSHEMFFALPVPLALLVAFREPDGSRAQRLRSGLVVGVAGALGVACILGLRAWLQLLPFETGFSGVASLGQAALGVGLRLLKVALLPTDLAVDVTVHVPPLAAVILSLLAVGAGTLWLLRTVGERHPGSRGPMLAGLSLVLLTSALHAGVVLKYGFISDRYAYAALVGLVLLVAPIAASVARPSRDPDSPLLGLLRRWGVVGLSLAILPLTWSRDASWYDQESLQLAMIESRPDDPESVLAAGMLAFGERRTDDAYPLCRRYLEARPDSTKANLCVGTWLLMNGRAEEAVGVLRPYALARPGMAVARRTFLFALISTGRRAEAAEVLRAWSAAFSGSSELEEARRALATAPPSPP